MEHGQYSSIFSKYEIVGGGHRLNALCPVCGCPDWERLLYVYLRECTEIANQSLRVLHLAPEPGVERRLRQLRQLDYQTLDFLSVDGICLDQAPRFDYAYDSFDVILCNHVLEHVAQDRCAMSEVFRVLRPGVGPAAGSHIV